MFTTFASSVHDAKYTKIKKHDYFDIIIRLNVFGIKSWIGLLLDCLPFSLQA